MKFISFVFLTIVFFSGCSKTVRLEDSINMTIVNFERAIVFADLKSEKIFYSNKNKANEKYPPCSTFKIWNSLIGIEKGFISAPDDEFYKWDKEDRAVSEWNKDLKFKEAFKVSCVPAFQSLAKKIGNSEMQEWINKINYGDRNISSGIDIFWLPREGKKSILISTEQQALLIKDLINKKLPFSEKSLTLLKDVMLISQTDKGILYGKTGTGKNVQDIPGNNIGWFIGYVISGKGSLSFACILRGEKFSGKDAKAVIIKILTETDFI